MRVTIKDVAKTAGVSVATASYALNGTGPVSQQRLQRVQEAAKELGYVPNGIAKALQAKRNGMAGYFAYSLSGPFFGQVMRGIEETFNASDEEIVACSCSSNRKKVTHLLRERMVDGTIIFGEHIEDEMIRRIAGANCPVVVMDRDLCSEYISSITIDNYRCAYEVGEYIHSIGFRKAGYIIGEGPDGIRREQGFRAAAKDFGIELRQEWVLNGDFQFEIARTKMLNWLAEKPELPEVFFTFNDEMAMGVIEALTKMGYQVPRDVSVIGMDDIPEAAVTSPRLTTYHLPIYEHGVHAAKQLLKMMKDSAPGSATVLTGYMVERESCRKSVGNTEE